MPEEFKVSKDEFDKVASMYGSSLMTLSKMARFVLSADKKAWDRFNGCVFCARHKSMGHRNDCELVEAKRALISFGDGPYVKELAKSL